MLYHISGDNEAACDIKAVKNGELLYQSERVLACSVIIENDVFFTGIVSAAMKNKVIIKNFIQRNLIFKHGIRFIKFLL